MEEKRRFDNLDIMKAFAIFFVLSLHVPLWKCDFINGNYINTIQYGFRIVSEGVPIFLVINGFLLLKKNEIDLKKHFKKMAKIVALIIVWAIILSALGCLISAEGEKVSFETIYFYLVNTEVGSKYTGVLWFLQNLLAVYMIYPLLWYCYKNYFDLFKYLFFVITFFVLGIDTLYKIRDGVVAFTHHQQDYFSCTIDFLNRFNPVANGWYVFYFCLGGILYKYYKELERYRLLLLLLGAVSSILAFTFGYSVSVKNGVLYNEAFNYGSIFMVFMIVGVMIFSMQYQNKGTLLEKILISIGRNCFGIYFVHFIFIFILDRFWYRNVFAERLGAFLIVLIASYIVTLLGKRNSLYKWLIEL